MRTLWSQERPGAFGDRVLEATPYRVDPVSICLNRCVLSSVLESLYMIGTSLRKDRGVEQLCMCNVEQMRTSESRGRSDAASFGESKPRRRRRCQHWAETTVMDAAWCDCCCKVDWRVVVHAQPTRRTIKYHTAVKHCRSTPCLMVHNAFRNLPESKY